MNAMFWILAGAIAGGLIGIFFKDKGYGRVLSTGGATSLDILFGVIGASIAEYVLFWAVSGKGATLNNYGAAVLGATILVGLCRHVSERYFRYPSYRGMSRAAFIEWHDSLTMKELATWKPPAREGSVTPGENR